jgi:hypothetical protein
VHDSPKKNKEKDMFLVDGGTQKKTTLVVSTPLNLDNNNCTKHEVNISLYYKHLPKIPAK